MPDETEAPNPRPLVDIRRDFFTAAEQYTDARAFGGLRITATAADRLEALARELVREEDRLKALGVPINA